METLKNEKFTPLSNEDLSSIKGGKWGSVCINSWYTCTEERGGFTTNMYQDYNIWGNPVGDPYTLNDNEC